MNANGLKELLFPFGNWWVYIVCSCGSFANLIFCMSIPALLVSLARQYTVETGVYIDYENGLWFDVAAFLFGTANNMISILLIFLIASAIFDAIKINELKAREAGYL